MDSVTHLSCPSPACAAQGRPSKALRRALAGIWITALGLLAGAAQAQEQCAYTARISTKDKLDHAGRALLPPLTKQAVLAAIRMDRANYHRFDKRDPEDETDCRFEQLAERRKIDKMLAKTRLPAGLMAKIEHGEPVLRIKVYEDRLEIAEASKAELVRAAGARAEPPAPARPASASATTARAPASGAQTSTAASTPGLALTEHEKTAEALRQLQKDSARQKSLLKWMGVPQYAQCAAMVADVDRKLRSGMHELTAEQWGVYPGVAASVAFLRQKLLAGGTTAAQLEDAQAAAEARQQSQGAQFTYEQCYKAMRPVYQDTANRK